MNVLKGICSSVVVYGLAILRKAPEIINAALNVLATHVLYWKYHMALIILFGSEDVVM